ncbi:IS982 family transposase, partial [Candidatus Acetothermia bacterium]|nr:IS982 family transposase [Candidatus Acetothermia bacterium]
MPYCIIAIYCVCDDFWKALGEPEDWQAQMTHAEVMTTALVAACFFGG